MPKQKLEAQTTKPVPEKLPHLNIPLPVETMNRIRAASSLEGKLLRDWAADALESAADHILGLQDRAERSTRRKDPK
jgi:anti-sigma factor ChrR (cupin superfamily)